MGTFNWSIYKINMFRCGLRSFYVRSSLSASRDFSVSKNAHVSCARMFHNTKNNSLGHSGMVFNFESGWISVATLNRVSLLSLIGCCRRRRHRRHRHRRCWLISLTSAINWNIILIVFFCWSRSATANLNWVYRTAENQYISIKKENLCSNQMGRVEIV